MINITIPKIEYERLKRDAARFRTWSARFFELVIADPVDAVVDDFKKTNAYTQGFLADLDAGLRASSYAKKYAHPAAAKRSRAVSR